jgi:hypothetical protein
MAISQKFMLETDDLQEFLVVAETILPILFNAGNNEDSKFHNMYYNKYENPNYWIFLSDSGGDDSPKRKCVLCLTHHLSKPRSQYENEIPMNFKSIINNHDNITWRSKLKWKKNSYKKLIDLIKESVSINEDDFNKDFPVNGWIKEESDIDGSYGMNYKMEWLDGCPGSLYISMGYTYYGK